jgi:chromosome transmission fidelity protein 1
MSIMPHNGSGTGNSELLPVLPTPDHFDFPYPHPYDIQLQLMQTVFRAIEDRKIAIVRFVSH